MDIKNFHAGKIDVEKFKVVTPGINTDEVIITADRINHINERHKGDFNLIRHFFPEILKNPDYILADDNPSTALILKEIETSGNRFLTVLRLHTISDNPAYKNSIISAWRINLKRWNLYLKTGKILYKRLDKTE